MLKMRPQTCKHQIRRASQAHAHSNHKSQWHSILLQSQIGSKASKDRDNRINQVLEARKFNYSLCTEKDSFILESSHEQHKSVLFDNPKLIPKFMKISNEISSNSNLMSAKNQIKTRPHTTAAKNKIFQQVKNNENVANSRGFSNYSVSNQYERKLKTAVPRKRKMNIETFLQRLGQSSHQDFLMEELNKYKITNASPLGKVIGILTQNRDQQSRLHKRFSETVDEVPQKYKELSVCTPSSEYCINNMQSFPISAASQKTPSRRTKRRESLQQYMQKNATPIRINKPEKVYYEQLLEKTIHSSIDKILPQIENSILPELPLKMLNILRSMLPEISHKTWAAVTNQDLHDVNQALSSKNFDDNLVEQLLSKIHFAENMENTYRIQFFNQMTLKSFKKRQIVVQGKKIADIFFILRGKLLITSESGDFSLQLNPGDIYAEELYIKTEENPNGYLIFSTTCFKVTAVEDVDLLFMSREVFYNLVMVWMKEELFQKLYYLKTCRLFSDIPVLELIKFASKLRISPKKYGEIVIKQNEIPECCSIVVNGTCKTLYEIIRESSCYGSAYARKSQQKRPDSLKFGLSPFGCEPKTTRNANNIKDFHFKKRKPNDTINFSYDNQIINTDEKGNIEYKSHVQIGCIQYGEYFGGRVLLESTKDLGKNKNNDKDKTLPSQLTIIADSAEVVLLEIRPEFMRFLGVGIHTNILSKIMATQPIENDRPFPNSKALLKEIKGDKNWRTYRTKLAEQHMKEQAYRRMLQCGGVFGGL